MYQKITDMEVYVIFKKLMTTVLVFIHICCMQFVSNTFLKSLKHFMKCFAVQSLPVKFHKYRTLASHVLP